MNSKAFSEVFQIIQYLPESEYVLIPKEQIDYIKKNMDKDSEKICTINTTIEDVNLSMEAKTILLALFYMNVATNEQKEKINRILLTEDKKQNEQMKKNMFNHNIKTKENDKNIEENIALIKYEEKNIFIKIKQFLKKIVRKNN